MNADKAKRSQNASHGVFLFSSEVPLQIEVLRLESLFHIFECFVHCRVPRSKSSVRIKTVEVPWKDGTNRFTYLFEQWAIKLLLGTKNQAETANLVRYGYNIINRIVHRNGIILLRQ